MKNKALAGHRWCAAVRTTSIGELDGPQYKACYLVNTKFRQTSQTLRSGRTGLFQTYTPEEICITKQKLKTNKQNRKQAPTIFFFSSQNHLEGFRCQNLTGNLTKPQPRLGIKAGCKHQDNIKGPARSLQSTDLKTGLPVPQSSTFTVGTLTLLTHILFQLVSFIVFQYWSAAGDKT